MRPTKPPRKCNLKKRRRPGYSRGYDLAVSESCKFVKNGANQTKNAWKLLSRDSLEVYKERRKRNMQNGRHTAKNRGLVGPSYGGSRAKSKKKIQKRVDRPRKKKKKIINNDSDTSMSTGVNSMSRSSYSEMDSSKSDYKD